MKTSLSFVVSPYQLAGQDPAAMGAALLADRVFTYRPTPTGGASKEAVASAVDRSPYLLRLMESWRWSAPLWTAGIVRTGKGGRPIEETVRSLHARFADEEPLRPLELLFQNSGLREDHEFLNALCEDIVKGGAHPGFGTLVSAALDAYAAENDSIVLRVEGKSLTQRAEIRVAKKCFSIAVPVLVRETSEDILEARAALEPQLDEWRAAFVESVASGRRTERLEAASDAYEHAFAEFGEAFEPVGSDRPFGVFLSLNVATLPVDVALRSGLVAVAQATDGRVSNALGTPDREITSIFVKALAVRPTA